MQAGQNRQAVQLDLTGWNEILRYPAAELDLPRNDPLEWLVVKILAIETTELVGSVAAAHDGNLLAELELDTNSRSAQSLAPGIKALLRQLGWRPQEVDLVAVTRGPGSFTGLRVGVTTAKVFAYAAGAEIRGVDTLETIASAVPDDLPAVSVAVDAQRGEVVAGTFHRGGDGGIHPTGPSELVALDDWLDGLEAGTTITGPILRKCAQRVPDHVVVLDESYWAPRATMVARLAARDHAAGRHDDLWSLVPRYSRRSAAEEKRDATR